MPKPELIARTKPEWAAMKLWLEQHIANWQLSLEVVGIPDSIANATRGKIAAYRQIIETVEPTIPAKDTSPNYHR